MSRQLPDGTVRGNIARFIGRNAPSLGDDVLEIGSLLPSDAAWWANNRPLAVGKWLGVDIQSGHNVDEVVDFDAINVAGTRWENRFTGILCSEVLEHVKHPWRMAWNMFNALRPGGVAVVTTLTAFPIHGYPSDYWRFTAAGLDLLLSDAGFRVEEVETVGSVQFTLDDHGSGSVQLRCPIHVFAKATKP